MSDPICGPHPGVVGTPELGELSASLRVRREQLGWSQSELARVRGVSRTVVNEVEKGRRWPSLGTYDKLRTALGLNLPDALALLPTAAPEDLSERFLVSVLALLVTAGRVDLAEAAGAVGVTTTRLRMAVAQAADRLAAVGLAAVDDGVTVELVVLAHATDLVEQVRELDAQVTLTPEALMVLIIVGHLGEATRRQVDERRGTDSASVLDRLASLGLIERRSDLASVGRPNAYRLTTRALTVLGHSTVESFQAWCRLQVDAALQDGETPETSWSAPRPGPLPRDAGGDGRRD